VHQRPLPTADPVGVPHGSVKLRRSVGTVDLEAPRRLRSGAAGGCVHSDLAQQHALVQLDHDPVAGGACKAAAIVQRRADGGVILPAAEGRRGVRQPVEDQVRGAGGS